MSTLGIELQWDPAASLLICGTWHEASSTFSVTDPATDKVLAQVAQAGPEFAALALDGASTAQSELALTTPRLRSNFLSDLYFSIIENAEPLAQLITAECGKPLAESRAEVQYGADYVRWYSEEALRIAGHIGRAPAGHTLFTTMKPVGPSYPVNFPLAMLTRKFAPAFAAGCTTIIKPASATPLTALYFAHLAHGLVEKYDLPGGTLSVLTTTASSELSEALLGDPRLRKLSFTGSSEVGSQLLRTSATNILRTSMELGGNAPFIVFEDSDLDAAVRGAMAAKMRNAGQTCVAANRFYVHATVMDEFTERLVEQFGELVVGAGTEEDVTCGPLISASAVSALNDLVGTALHAGAEVSFQSDIDITAAGNFYPPTILSNVTSDNPITRTEIFGPIAPLISFDTTQEVISYANDTQYGLCAYAYTDSAKTITTLNQQLECGILGINTGLVSDAAAPFGGVKNSGIGREGGSEGIAEYLSTQYVSLH